MFDNMAAAQCASLQILQVLPCFSRLLIVLFKESPLGQGEEMESREREGDRNKMLALRVRWRE